uniref:Uncharacterized protein n=1 Tax=Cannabis sativa TaxID=3483 RepID=A0A803PHI4_CANSA
MRSQAQLATEEEDNEGDVEVQEIKDQGKVRPGSPSEAKEEGVPQPLRFGGYNEAEELVSEVGDVLEEGDDYITEVYTDVVPQRRQVLNAFSLLQTTGQLIKERDIVPSRVPIPSKCTLKGIKYLSALFILYATKGWGERSPHDTNWLFDLKSTHKQRWLGYFYFSQLDNKWLKGTVDPAVSKIGILWMSTTLRWAWRPSILGSNRFLCTAAAIP